MSNAALVPQSYGIAGAQNRFGGPYGVWLECRECPASQKIAGVDPDALRSATDAECADVFKRHGWTGNGDKMLAAKCPSCSQKASIK